MAREKTEFDCGECEPCVESEYVDDDPNTHCLGCTCFLCIPGN